MRTRWKEKKRGREREKEGESERERCVRKKERKIYRNGKLGEREKRAPFYAPIAARDHSNRQFKRTGSLVEESNLQLLLKVSSIKATMVLRNLFPHQVKISPRNIHIDYRT